MDPGQEVDLDHNDTLTGSFFLKELESTVTPDYARTLLSTKKESGVIVY